MNYQITALKVGEQYVAGPQMFYMNKWDEWLKINMYVWLIQGGEKNILVDTGIRDTEEINTLIIPVFGDKAKYVVKPGDDIISVLKKVNLVPEKIDNVILTHLHYDHSSNLKLFKNARIFVSKRGLINTIAPEHRALVPAPLFPKDILAYLVNEASDRLHLTNDEEEILPDIMVSWVGGHSQCSQIISIRVSQERYILTGDIVFLYENIEKDIPVGFNYNLRECYAGMEKIRKTKGVVLPSHDPNILEVYPGGRVI